MRNVFVSTNEVVTLHVGEHQLMTNTETGITTFDSMSIKEEGFHQGVQQIRNEHEEQFAEYLETVFQQRGIRYKQAKELVHTPITSLFALIRYRNLQHFPMPYVPFLTEEQYEDIASLTRGKEQIFELVGHNSPSIMKLCRTQAGLTIAMLWGEQFKRVINVVKLTAFFEENSVELPQDEEDFNQGMRLLRVLHTNETVLANRIMNWYKKAGSQKEQIMLYIEHIGNIYGKLKGKRKEFPRFNGNIGDLRRTILEDYHLFLSTNSDFEYSDEVAWEQTVNKYSFQLAKNPLELHNVGRELVNAVSHYARFVREGKSRIVLMRKPGSQKTNVCIEIRDHAVVQAKIKHNAKPSSEQAAAIHEWAKVCGFQIHTSDLPKIK